MSPTVREEHNLKRFFDSIKYKVRGYRFKSFSYLAVEENGKFFIRQARLMLNTNAVPIASRCFRSEHVIAETYSVDEPRQLVDQLVSGLVATPNGELSFEPNEGNNFLALYEPSILRG